MFKNGSEFYEVLYSVETASFAVVAILNLVCYDFVYNSIHRNATKNPKWASHDGARVAPPSDIVHQIKTYMDPRDKRFDNSPLHVYRIIYSLSVMDHLSSCANLTQNGSQFLRAFPELLFDRNGARKVSNRFKQILVNTALTKSDYILGDVNRPRICIFPALILLSSLFLLSTLIQITNRTDSVTVKV